MADYEILLYNSQNATQTLLGDITSVCSGVKFSEQLNNFPEFSCSINIEDWRKFSKRIGIDPYISLKPLTSEIKIKRNGAFLPFEFEIKSSPKDFGAGNISIDARGTLSKLADRFISKTYSATDSAGIARDVIATTQSLAIGSFGITDGNSYMSGVLSDRTYERYSIIDAIRNLADDESGGFDFYFDHDWKFYTMSHRGSLKDDVTYRYGDDGSNVLNYKNPETSSGLYNYVMVVGEGIGNPISATAIDSVSRAEYGLRMTALSYSNIDNMAWLNNKAQSELRNRKNLYDLPTITVDGSVFDINYKWVGDTIPLISVDEISPYVGNGRIRAISVSLDDNHYETIDLELLEV